MKKQAVKYKDTWLMPGSKAWGLYMDDNLPALDKHLKQLDQNERELLKRYEKAVPN